MIENILQDDCLMMGTCYYPEHWPKKMWENDLRRMLENGIEVIRIAEFAWSLVEPREGEYTYSFFDEFLSIVEKVGIKVIFCTPTATPPAWLTTKYPEVLNTTMEGIPYEHGARRHYNYNAPKYRELSATITEKFVVHYGQHPNIIGWQIDNELNCEKDEFYSESDSIAFRAFAKDKYNTLEQLNKAWGTTFWNQDYTDWGEVDIPKTTVSNSTNPHRVLDYLRFISASVCSYAKLQSEIIRQFIKPDDFITTNGMFSNLDNHKMNQESLDFFTYDSYPNFAYSLNGHGDKETDLKDRNWSRNLAEVRSISPRFGIMEQQSGANGWVNRIKAPTPRPGQLTLWTMQSVAHGADFVSYFRWRTCTMGTEIYWHGILDYSSRDNRRLKEVNAVSGIFKQISDVAGAKYEAELAIIKDYDNVWDAKIDEWHLSVEHASEKALFEAAQLSHTPLDFVYLKEATTVLELSQYKVVFYPHATIITEERTALLEAYVKAGGTLIMGCRSGYKDLTGQCTMEKLPGMLSKLTGTDIPEYTFIPSDSGTNSINWNGTIMEANIFLDLLDPSGASAQLEAKLTSGDYVGAGILVKNTFGKGVAYYYGSAFNKDSATIFMEKLHVLSPYKHMIQVPTTCEIAIRKKDDKKFLFILNYKKESANIKILQEMLNLYTGEKVKGDMVLEKYGTMVLLLE